jgi:hypothetical protein
VLQNLSSSTHLARVLDNLLHSLQGFCQLHGGLHVSICQGHEPLNGYGPRPSGGDHGPASACSSAGASCWLLLWLALLLMGCT